MSTNLEETRKIKAMLEALQKGFKIKFPSGEVNLTVKKKDALDKALRDALKAAECWVFVAKEVAVSGIHWIHLAQACLSAHPWLSILASFSPISQSARKE